LSWSLDADNLADGWQPYGANAYRTFRWLGNDYRAAYYVVISNDNPIAPKITASGYLRYDYEYKHASGSTATAGSTFVGFQQKFLVRKVQVNTRKDALWTLAMLADRQIDLKGNNITADSFDSSDPNASYFAPGAAYGTYDSTKRGDNGDVATNGQLINSLNVGNADIMGRVATGPGGTIAIGPSGSVGSEAWVSSGNTGIQEGYQSGDMNVKLSDVGLPSTTWLPIPTAGGTGTNINGVLYKHVILLSGDYKASTFQGSVYVGPGVDARIYVTDNVYLTGNEQLTITPNARRLTLYMQGSRFMLSGGGVQNEAGYASAFLYFGLPSNREIILGGNAAFVGAIYAPMATFTLGGGGSDDYDFIGASVTRDVVMNGHYNFHYDENLSNFGPSRGFIPTSWAEL